MRIFMNFREVRGPYGGTNSFLRTLRNWLAQQDGIQLTHDPRAEYDVALLSGLTDGVDLALVTQIAARGIPVVHRKVGYRVSGGPEMRRVVDGVVWGDKLQVAFTPHLTHTIFQSHYSRDVFVNSGFDGPHSVIYNGVDEAVFNTSVGVGWLRRRTAPRDWWDGRSPLRVLISSWSKDPNKGFDDYVAIDAVVGARRDVQVSFVGRVPDGLRFQRIRVHAPRGRDALARLLKEHHVILQLARFETCSNALIEGINCGLPAIFLDSGSNTEIAAHYGVGYDGGWEAALAAIRTQYSAITARLPHNPFRVSIVGPQYLGVVAKAAQQTLRV